DVLPCGYVAFSDDGAIKSCNSTLALWVGSGKDEFTGKNIESIFTVASRIFYHTHFFPLIKLHSVASEILLSLKCRDDRDLAVLATAEERPSSEGTIIHCVFVRAEERKKYEHELLQARRDAEA